MHKTKLVICAMAIVVIAFVITFNYGGCGGGGGGGSSGSSTPPATTPPAVATLPATNVTLTTATLNGTVNPNGVALSVSFQFGTTTAYGSNTAPQNIGSGTTPVIVTATITGLSPNTLYNFRIRVATTDGSGIVYNGANQTFTTGLPPTCATNPATNITSNSARLNGTVNPNGVATTAYFNYGLTTSYTITTTAQAIGSGAISLAVSATITSLTLNAEYNFRVVGTNSFGTTYGSNRTFTAAAPPPTCVTNPATNINSNSAKLNGTVNPNGTATNGYFNYGLTTSYGSSTTSQSIGNGTTNVALTADISGLSGSTLYNFRVVGTNSAGTTNGNNLTFTTGAPIGSAPTCTTDPADNITYNSATLNGTVNPNGTDTNAYFQWGTTTSYGNTTTSQSIGSGVFSLAVSATVSSLTPNTLYNFRVAATNSGGTTNGLNQTFSTGAPPTPTTVAFVQQPTNTTAGASITPAVTVRVTDQYNNLLLGVPVSMIVLGGSPALYGTLTGTTDASGTATFNNLSVQVAGAGYRLRAAVQ